MNTGLLDEIMDVLEELQSKERQESEWVSGRGRAVDGQILIGSWPETYMDLIGYYFDDSVVAELTGVGLTAESARRIDEMRRTLKSLRADHGVSDRSASAVIEDPRFDKIRDLASELRSEVSGLKKRLEANGEASN